MKKLTMLIAGGIISVVMPLTADTWTDPSTGYTWRYRIKDGTAEIFTEIYCCTMPDYAISPSPEGAVTIPDTLGGKPVTSIGDQAFAGCIDLTSITIPASVTNISDSAFHGCDGLADTNGFIIVRNVLYGYVGTETSVTIPDDVTGIGYSAFSGCSELTSVTIPASVTSIGDYAFSCCENLANVTIPASVTSIGYSAFYGCSGLTDVTIPASVTSIGESAFHGCDGLADTNGFIIVCNVLYGYVGTETSVTIPASVTSIGESAFSSCSELTSMTIPNSVISIGDSAFYNCSGLTNVVIGSSVTSIGDGAFSCCENLASVTIPASVTSIGEYAFEGCYNLSRIIFNGNAPDVGYGAFENMDSSCVGYANKASTGWEVDGNGLWQGLPIEFIDDMSALPDYVLTIVDGVLTGVKLYGATEITIPTNVTSIGDWAFSSCIGLASITIPASVTSIGDYVFGECGALESFIVAADNPSYKSVSGLLLTKDGKTLVHGVNGDVTIPDGVEFICDDAFKECIGLTRVTIPASVTSLGDTAFGWCGNLTSVTIPSNVVHIGDGVFTACSSLRGVEVSEFNPAYKSVSGLILTKDGKSLVQGFNGDVTIPDGVELICDYAFWNCDGLTSVTLPDSTTHIGRSAFSWCESLTCVTIPSNVTNIDDRAFGCCGLTNVIFMGNAPTVGDTSFTDEFWGYYENATFYVRKGSTGWGVEIPGMWNGMNIQYLTPDVEIAVANEAGRGTVEIDRELSDTEVASGVTLVVKGENLDAAELAAKITPRPHEDGQSASLFKVKAEPVAGGVSLAVVLDEEAVDPDATAAEIVGSESVAAFGAAAEGENVPVSLPSAKPGLYYGIAAVNDLSQMDAAAASAPLVRAGAGGVAVPVAKPAGTSAFFKVIVSDRAR